MPSLLEVSDLVKHFKSVQAVNGVSFSVERGSCFGLLGPNGAGKTTTIEIMEGIKAPTGGSVLYKGEPLAARFRHEAGIMFQSTALQEFITVRETLQMFAQLYSKTLPIESLIETCVLQEFLDRDTRQLSGGQRQRLLLAIALINDPEIVFLDEPTTGLDPQSRHNFWNLINDIREQGKTIILTTHYMEEAYTLCNTIAIMDHGRIIAQGTPKELLAAHFSDVVLQLPLEGLPAHFAGLPFETVINRDAVEILSHDVNATIQELLQHGIDLKYLQIRNRTLEDLFLEITGKELRH
ncbi:MAG: ABC transporter ATP-binding protein [Gammaproteobacteria bacterium]|nr:ABC transporter ATP-binding protein [Gammaproteobacteria bacterium]MDH5651461.1 ABC transporter ATP-binding protein [Gammaproteobacteria bacterium]